MYYADLGHGIGSEQEGYRPVVIIQNDVGNKHSPTVIIASITSKKDAKPKLPTHYYIGIEAGLELPSIVLLEQLRTVDKRRLSEFIGHLPEKHIQGINHALAVSIGLIDSVPKKLILCLCSIVPTIFMVQVLLLCGGSTRHKPKKIPALIATAERALIMRSFQRPDRRGNEITGSIPTCVCDYPDIVNVEQMCEMLGGISQKTAYRLLKNGTIKSFVVGRRYRIPKICIFEYLEIIDKSPA